MTLGAYGPLTLDQARKKAIKERAKAIEGRDPLAERRARKAEENVLHLGNTTVAELAVRYLEYSRDRKKSNSLRSDRQMIRDYVKPELGRRRIEEVRTAHIVDLHQSLRDRPYAANRLLALLRRMFNLARKWDDRSNGAATLVNPCEGVEAFDEEARERYLTPEELGRLGEVLSRIEQEGSIPADLMGSERDISVIASAVTAIRLILFTGCRREEILTLKWAQVDRVNSRITLLDSKVGQRMFPIGEAAVEVLATAPRKQGNPYVCWGKKVDGHLVGLPKIWGHIREAIGIEDVRIHDLRHTFGSVGVGPVGLNLPVVGKLLGHTQASTTQRYAHVAISPAKAAADRISGEIAANLAGGTKASNIENEEAIAELAKRIQHLSTAEKRQLQALLHETR